MFSFSLTPLPTRSSCPFSCLLLPTTTPSSPRPLPTHFFDGASVQRTRSHTHRLNASSQKPSLSWLPDPEPTFPLSGKVINFHFLHQR
uniref:Putative secreted protein n=1 Tax=Anopheles darlingi TaxID=43151 RepID=A0A2M4DAJ8_ANODA